MNQKLIKQVYLGIPDGGDGATVVRSSTCFDFQNRTLGKIRKI